MFLRMFNESMLIKTIEISYIMNKDNNKNASSSKFFFFFSRTFTSDLVLMIADTYIFSSIYIM